MSVAGPGLDDLLENLNQLGLQNSHLIAADVKENLDNLKLELGYLKTAVGNFSRYDDESLYLNVTSKEIRGIIDEAEDTVDTYTVMAAIRKSKSWISKTFHGKIDARDARKWIGQMADKVREINEKIMRARNVASYPLVVPRVDTPTIGMSSEAPTVEEDNVIGFQRPAEVVRKLLVEERESLEVIAIAGMSGLGKTTLAKMVLKDPMVDYEYMIRAFVYVSRQYDKKDVLLQILSSFSIVDKEVREMNKEQLEKHVFKELKGKQYLIVLDDVWETEDWDAFKGAFPNNDKRCRVLITTTNTGLAEYANPINPDSLYMLEFLTLQYSRELLQWKVFGQSSSPIEIQQYLIEIAQKCEGLPLAIVLISGVLRDRRDRVTWWKEVSGSVHKFLSRDASEGNKAIEMMYEHLPNKLKPCFVYLGVFRPDYEIPVWKLVRLWISEGFIVGGEISNLELEDIAEHYLEELVQRNLVMVGKRRSNGKIKTCRMHDTLRQFCKTEANEENLFQEVNRQNLNMISSGNASLDYRRRICINDPIIGDYLSGPASGKRVRSFITFQKEESPVDARHISAIPKTFKLLKVLEAQCLTFNRFPVDLIYLVLLKYLAISCNFSTIPSALSSLWNLQTLIVYTTSRTLQVKMDLWKLAYFRHFHANAAASLPNPADTKGQSLRETNVRTLCTISPECCNRNILDRTPRLKKLGIYGDLAKFFGVAGGSSKLEELNELENLKLLNDDTNSKLFGLPSHTCFPPHLTKLTLTNTRLDWKEMSTLGRLENLEVLKLKELAFQGAKWVTEEGGFKHLVHLFIGQTNLLVWEAGNQHFPMLRNLELNGCDKLQALPHGLVDIPCLQSISLHRTNPVVASYARRFQVQRLKTKDNKCNLRLSIYPPDH